MIISNRQQQESYDYLHKLFDYDGQNLIWKVNRQGTKGINSIAGTKDKDGYIVIRLDNKAYKAHRLIWMFVNGYMPENSLDHINRIKTDNRIENLREVSNQCNIQNAGMWSSNTSGIKGVSWHKQTKKWVAHIKVNQKAKHLGRFVNKIDAAKARYQAEIKYNWQSCEAGGSSAKQFINNN